MDKCFVFLLSQKEVLRKLGGILRCFFSIVNDFKLYASLSDIVICLLLSNPITCRKQLWLAAVLTPSRLLSAPRELASCLNKDICSYFKSMCTCVGMCSCECKSWSRPKASDLLRAGVTEGCGLLDVSIGTQP